MDAGEGTLAQDFNVSHLEVEGLVGGNRWRKVGEILVVGTVCDR